VFSYRTSITADTFIQFKKLIIDMNTGNDPPAGRDPETSDSVPDAFDRRSILRTLGSGLVAFGGTSGSALAQEDQDGGSDDRQFEVSYGTNSELVAPFSGTESITDVYDYSSYTADIELQKEDTARLFLYDGPNGLSLGTVIDSTSSDDGGQTGYEIDGFPADGAWVIKDDSGDTYGTAPAWSWDSGGNTDGGVIRGGFDGEFEITITPELNQGRDDPDNDEDGTVDGWEFVYGEFENGSFQNVEVIDLKVNGEPQSVTITPSGQQTEAEAPEPSITITDGNETTNSTELRQPLLFDAGESSNPDGSIVGYEWDFTDNGSIDVRTTESTVTHTFSSVGERPVTLRVTGDSGNTAETTQSVNVHLSQYTETLNQARSIDEASVLSIVNQELPETDRIPTAESQAEETLSTLEDAVLSEQLDQLTAQRAAARLSEGHAILLETTRNAGPATGNPQNFTGQLDKNFNVGSTIAKIVTQNIFEILVTKAATQLAVSTRLDDTTAGFVLDSIIDITTKLSKGASRILEILYGSKVTRALAKQELSDAADTIAEQIRSGELANPSQIERTVGSVGDDLIQRLALLPRADVDLGTRFAPTAIARIEPSEPSAAEDAVDVALSEYGNSELANSEETYSAAAVLNERLRPTSLSAGLSGSTEVAEQIATEHATRIRATLVGVNNLLDELQFSGSQIGIYQTLIDVFTNDDPPVVELLSTLGTLAEVFLKGVVSTVLNSAIAASGLGPIPGLKRSQAAAIDSIVQGEDLLGNESQG
jgi:PKD repeat protein